MIRTNPFRHRGVLGASLVVLLLWAGAASAATLQDIGFTALLGDRTEIRLQFDGPPPQPTGYAIEQPARIAIDLAGVSNGLSEKRHALGMGNARDVTVVEAGGVTRMIVGLSTLVPYSTRIEGNDLVVLVGDGDVADPGATVSDVGSGASVQAPAGSVDAGPGESSIRDIDFRRGSGGDGEVVIRLSNPKAGVDISTEGGSIRVEVRDTTLPPELQRKLDVTDFATPVNTIDTIQDGLNTVMMIRPIEAHEYLAYQADDLLTINVRPLAAEGEDGGEDDVFRFKGEKLSLNFQDIEIRSVLQLIADFTDLNLVASDTVAGRITLRLKNVPWDQALDLILKTKGLDKRQVGNVLLVAPAAEIATREKLELENQKQILDLAPLRTEFIQVRYATAADIVSLFGQGGEGGTSMLSERGSVIVDERTNAIIVTDTTVNLEEIRRVVSQLDIPVRQVLIEARIVTANASYSESFGVRWGGGGTETAGQDRRLQLGGTIEGVNQLQQAGQSTGTPAITSPSELVVDLGAAGTATRFGIGFTGEGYLLDLELSALATDGHAEVVARPKVITSDKQAATIQSGVQIPFQEASSSGATATQFKEAVLSLEVTPQITPDNRIIMDLKINRDSVGTVFNGVPSINTNEIETQVLVDDGQTIVLGGIYQTSTTSSVTKTPFFGDLPYVGQFFRRTTDNDDKQELLIFITPKILQDALINR